MENGQKLVISVQEARNILGKSYDKYNDLYIEMLIKNLDAIVETFIKSIPKY